MTLKLSASSLDTLPDLVVQNILKYFNFKDIFMLRAVSKKWLYQCEQYLERSSDKLREKYILEGRKINEKLNHLNRNEKLFHDYLTKYYNVQLILNEIDIILLKQNLHCEYYLPGHLLDYLQDILKQINKEPQLLLDIYKKFSRLTKTYFYNPFYIKTDYLGVHVINLLNLLKDVKYLFRITYDTVFQTCHIKAEYYVLNFKVFKSLLYLAEDAVSFAVNENIHTLSNKEKCLLLKQLILITDLHNSFIIQNNIFDKNIEKSCAYLYDNFKMFEMSRTKKIYSKLRHKIQETYTNIRNDSLPQDRLWCKINVRCSLNNAPDYIMKIWKNILQEEIPRSRTVMKNFDNFYFFQIKFKLESVSKQKASCILKGKFQEKKQNMRDTQQNIIVLNC